MLDTAVTLPATPSPRRRWTGEEDAEAGLLHGMGLSDEHAGQTLGRSAKSVHHRRARIMALAAASPGPAVPEGSDLARAAAEVEAAEVALEAAHRRYAQVMSPLVRPVADALRLAGISAADDTAQGGPAWELVEALRQVGVELRVPA